MGRADPIPVDRNVISTSADAFLAMTLTKEGSEQGRLSGKVPSAPRVRLDGLACRSV